MWTNTVDKEDFGILDQVIHITFRIFGMCKSVKAIYIFSHKIKLTYLIANKSEK